MGSGKNGSGGLNSYTIKMMFKKILDTLRHLLKGGDAMLNILHFCNECIDLIYDLKNYSALLYVLIQIKEKIFILAK